jgi:hypothetical protein
MNATVTASYNNKLQVVKELSTLTPKEQMVEIAAFQAEYYSMAKKMFNKVDTKKCSFVLKVGL